MAVFASIGNGPRRKEGASGLEFGYGFDVPRAGWISWGEVGELLCLLWLDGFAEDLASCFGGFGDKEPSLRKVSERVGISPKL